MKPAATDRFGSRPLLVVVAMLGCHGATVDHPHAGTAASFATPVGGTVHGIAGNGTLVFAAHGAEVEARTGTSLEWHVAMPGAGVMAIGKDLYATSYAEPTSAVVALDPATGAQRWKTDLRSGEYSIITSIAASDRGIVVGGTFSGTLRIGKTVVASGGRNDGFVALLGLDGSVTWLIRVGGANADAVQGVAIHGDRVAIAGTFMATAELLGEPLVPFDERIPAADCFVAELDLAGARRWSQSFGGEAEDAIAGIAIDSKQRVVVAATVRDTIKIGDRQVATRGEGDGLVAWFSPAGELGATTVIGGLAFDGLRSIAAVDDRVVVAGFFHGAIALGKRAIDSSNSDDAFLVDVNAAGELETAWHATGAGREEVTALSAVPGGFVAAIAHTAGLSFDGAEVSAEGAVLVGRPAP